MLLNSNIRKVIVDFFIFQIIDKRTQFTISCDTTSYKENKRKISIMKTGSVTLLILLLVFDYGCASATNTTNVKASARKGVCIAPEYFRCEDVSALSGVSWYYNWGTHPNNQVDHS